MEKIEKGEKGEKGEKRVYFNRDISWIDFNERVLEEGLRRDLPPLERFRFLSIVSSNFDEFFMVRVAGIKRIIRSGASPHQADPSGLSPRRQFKKGADKIRSLFRRQYACLEEEVFPALAQGGLELVRPDRYAIHHIDYLESLFIREVYPVLTPLKIEPDEPFPAIESLCLHVIFLLAPEGGASGEHISVVKIPPVLNRIIWLPHENGGAGAQYALLEDMVITWGGCLYQGFQVKERMLFKINRDADFSVDEQRDEDFLVAMEEVLEHRGKSMVVRMMVSPGSEYLRDTLARRMELLPEDLYEINGPLNLRGLLDLVETQGFEHLKEPAWKIYNTGGFTEEESLWEKINQKDVMLHLPYQSFDPVLRFFQDAASDPQVISIKTTLYRTSGNSPIIRSLEQAALNGKHVTAVVELKARFDEERNISWANRLEKAGVIVIYGLARLKVHAKVSVVIRREDSRIKRYVHLSTGNYNDKTAKLYEDISIFTARDDIAFDVGLIFNTITGYSVIQAMRQLVIAPVSLKARLLDLISREARRSTPEYPGRIMAKMNALADIDIINALYKASCAGVRILLNIRGVCMLVPGVPGLSEHIRVVSVIDRYLEHSRIVSFANGGAQEVYLSSADWMSRNLERRVELMFPVLQDDLKAQVSALLEAYFRDNCQARALGPDGAWKRQAPPPGEKPFRVQAHFLAQARENAEPSWETREEFVVRRPRRPL
ncbi:MAG: polyphosphate kinase 1 [Spirochaetaceae bacterium]|jgi:polyphosphate kinase|nr:polyphosphate kinase 1 [Spirochaetaceae bacterium]